MLSSVLRKIVTRGCEFSGKGDFAQNCVFKVKNGIFELRASNGMTGICINTILSVDMKDMECAVNIFALEAALKVFDSNANIEIKINKNKLSMENEEDKAAIPIMDVDTVFYIPKPQNWIPVPPNFEEKLITIRGMHFKTVKGMDKDFEDLIVIKGNDICQLSRSVSIFETTETDINIAVELKLLQKVTSNIDAYCVDNRRLYFKNDEEWVMISTSSKTIPKFEMLFSEVQKTNNSVISISSDEFLGFCEKLITLKKAEELSVLNPNHYVRLEFKKDLLIGITEVGSTQIKVDNSDLIFNCAVVADFFKASSSKLFLKNDILKLCAGKDMRLLQAVNDSTKIMGVLCRV
jgi:hypothetical protein